MLNKNSSNVCTCHIRFVPLGYCQLSFEKRVIQFKKEQLEFNKKKGINSRIQEVKTAKKVYNLAISNLLQIQTCD